MQAISREDMDQWLTHIQTALQTRGGGVPAPAPATFPDSAAAAGGGADGSDPNMAAAMNLFSGGQSMEPADGVEQTQSVSPSSAPGEERRARGTGGGTAAGRARELAIG